MIIPERLVAACRGVPERSPFVGDRAYDVTQHLFNCNGRMCANPMARSDACRAARRGRRACPTVAVRAVSRGATCNMDRRLTGPCQGVGVNNVRPNSYQASPAAPGRAALFFSSARGKPVYRVEQRRGPAHRARLGFFADVHRGRSGRAAPQMSRSCWADTNGRDETTRAVEPHRA